MRVHDEFCFVGDIYDESENYMCICNRLSSAREQAIEDAINAPGLHPRIASFISEIEQRCVDRVEATVLTELEARVYDLSTCNRGDDCEVKGEGARLALDDARCVFAELKNETERTAMTNDDLIRELSKAAHALGACDRHFAAAAEANAALHMSERVIPNPLASHVSLTLTNILNVLAREDVD